ncbi:MAG: transposase [Candidatus Shapirobacteria bacterium]
MLSYNVKLFFNSAEDQDVYKQTLEVQKFTYNEASKVHFGVAKNSLVELHNKFYKPFREKYPEIPSNIVIHTIQEVLSAYRSIKSNKHEIDKPIEKKKLSIRLTKNTCTLKVFKNQISLTSIGGKRIKAHFIPYPKLQELINNYPVCDPLIFVRDDVVWLSLTFDTPNTVVLDKLVVGVDLGIKNAVATSEGKVFQDKKYNADKRKLRYLKRNLRSKRDKGSKSSKRHLKKLRRKERNQSKDQSHKTANWIINSTDANVIAVEDLKDIKKNTFKKNKRFNNKWSQVPIGELIRILEYKALRSKKKTVKVNPAYTSQRDSRTNKLDGVRIKGKYIGIDGKTLHSDINAAINIANLTKLPLSGNEVSRQIALLGQAKVNSPIVGFGSLQASMALA